MHEEVGAAHVKREAVQSQDGLELLLLLALPLAACLRIP
eukprot:CAMPEP_0113296524 /NCGR_PEP_ID=MMETSP0008_2-20120614/37040_1 /TAXON_ID=97485 /ORGANISM="Prymnesium parvum" /LENGTH=38 /DNA_ID=CAMNT_0000149333 /DNA_START=749 /DNA_END=861 /DNA_ORIENTATION=- /assembly_acc=CAM_ASM_000153